VTPRAAGRLAALLGLAAALGAPARAQVADWPTQRPPAALAAHDVHFPPYEMRTLDNGLRIVIVPHHEEPAVSLRLLVGAGGAQDPPGKPGVANLMAAVMDQGTTTRSAEDIQRTIDDIGGALGVGAGTDLSFVNAVVMKPDFGLALDLVSDIARHAAFAAQEIERQRSQRLSGLRVSRDDPGYIADTVFDRLVYGFHPYGRPSSGTAESIPTITRDDLVSFHDRYFAPNNAILAIVGDVTTEEALAGAVRVFGTWPRRDVARPEMGDPPPPARRVVVVDRPGAVQTEIRVGLIGVPRKSPDYMALNLAIKVLGGEGANRLQRVLRSERGLTYGASADFDTLQQSGDIEAQTNTRSSATGEALRVIVDEFSRLRRERVNRAELEGAQDYLAGSFPLSIETPSQIALQILNHVFYGIDLKNLDDFPERVNAVTPGDIQRVAEKYIQPDRLSIVLVGDADTFVSQLRGAGFATYERVGLDQLDLDQADLKRPAAAGRPPAATPAAAVPAPPAFPASPAAPRAASPGAAEPTRSARSGR
jgi:zinc protease